jgi:polysaccharide export outer membrane protein
MPRPKRVSFLSIRRRAPRIVAQEHLPEVYWSARYNTILWKIRQDCQNRSKRRKLRMFTKTPRLTRKRRSRRERGEKVSLGSALTLPPGLRYPSPPIRAGAASGSGYGALSYIVEQSSGAMQHHHSCRARCHFLTALVATAAIVGSGCAGHVYRASKLPPELLAPPALDLETINLSGLSDQSVSAEVIQPGDVLDVTMMTDYAKLTTTTTPVRVADDGTVLVPLVGRLSVGGMEIEQAEQTVNGESIARGVFRNPCITMTMKQCRTRKVTVVGAVNKPGTHELPRGSTSLMAALLAADGLSKEAGTEVEIRHTDSRQAMRAGQPLAASGPYASAVPASYEQPGAAEAASIKVDLAAATSGLVKVPDLRDGDVVHVAKRTLPPIYVIGLVTKPGSFPYPPNQDIRVLDAVALAGGCSNPLAEDILLIRRIPGAKEPVRIAVSLQGAKNGQDNVTLAPGDTVSVERTPATAVADVIQTFFRVGLGANVSWF